MTNPANSTVQNLLPVQAYFDENNDFVTFIGQGQPFYAIPDPQQSGLHITNSTIDSSPIGSITPSTAVFTSGQVNATPTGNTDIANKLYVDSVAAGLSWKQPFQVATLANITLSGLQTIDGYTTVAGDRVLVKNQGTAANNGIYIASSGAWSRSADGDAWNDYISAIGFIEYGGQAGSAWYCSAQAGGTLGVTALNWSNFSVAGVYYAGTGLTLAAYTFSITNTGVVAGNYGNDARSVTLAINAQGQITSAVDQPIAIAGSQITSGTIGSSYLSGTYSGITGVGTLANLTVTNTIVGNAQTATSATSATTATNIAGGAAGSLPYQSAAGTTALLAAGTNGQVLTLASGIPSWATPTTGTVTSVSGTGTVSGISLSGTVTSSGSLTLGGTLDLSSPPAIGGTTANTIAGTTITANTSFKGTYYDANTSGGGNLRTNTGVACLQWGGGGGTNVTVDGSININGANAAIQMNPTGTGTVSIAPAGALTINPTTASTMNNVAIGGTTALAGTFTDLRVNGTISLAGSTGTSGYALISNGASAPTWQAISAGLTVTDDTTTASDRYLTFTSATSGTITGINTSSTKLKYVPSTGVLDLSSSLGAINIPAGTTAQRPSTPANGMLRYNSSTGYLEGYINGGWQFYAGTSAPVNSVAPVVSGGTTVGSTLTTTNGTWSNSPTGYTYQWYRTSSPISGATSSTYTLVTADNTNTIYCAVTATNPAGSVTQNSNTVGPVTSTYTISFLSVAGGASGGFANNGFYQAGGGGGSGGFVTGSFTATPTNVYTATVGGGGATKTSAGQGNAGSNTSLTGQTTAVGGGGGGGSGAAPATGGSGGGGEGQTNTTGAAGTSGQGNTGGNGTVNGFDSTGGGGGGCGANGGGQTGGGGYSSSITGSSVTYGGGGGGAGSKNGSGGGGGGAGGGGAGGGNGTAGGNGGTNTGGGGGGGSPSTGTNGGAGGSGVVILSMPTANYTGTTTGSPTISTSGSQTIVTFTSSGTYTA
jgi:hypothetical protein